MVEMFCFYYPGKSITGNKFPGIFVGKEAVVMLVWVPTSCQEKVNRSK